MKKFALFIIITLSILSTNICAQVAVGVQISVAPPDLPVYVQPPCPVEGYMWSPGYWAYGPDGYYWVPGVWVAPPDVELLWTPGYWGFDDGFYLWHAGYWGPEIGFYGGVCYGFGYTGVGFYGGRWEGREFRYNTSVWRVNSGFHNTYSDRSVGSVGARGKSFNGPGGITSRPTPAEQSAMNGRHVQPTSDQVTHEHNASTNRNQLASVNKGRPATTAMNSVKGTGYGPEGHTANTNNLTKHSAPQNSTTTHHTTRTAPTHTSSVPSQHHPTANTPKPQAQPKNTHTQAQTRPQENRARTQPSQNSTQNRNTQHTPAPQQNREMQHTPPPQQNREMQHTPPPQQHTPPPAPHNMGGEPHRVVH